MSATETQEKPAKGGLRALAESRGELFYFDPDVVQIEEGFNVRDLERELSDPKGKEKFKELKADLLHNGQRVPAIVRFHDGKVVVVAGHRRLLALRELKAEGKEVRFMAGPEPKGTSEIDRLSIMASTQNAKDLEPLEYAELCARMKKLGLTDTEIGKRIGGKTGPYVSGLLKLLEAPSKIIEVVKSGQTAAATVIDQIREHKGDYEKVYQSISDGIAEAAATGGTRVTPKHIKKAAEKKAGSQAERPLRYKKEVVDSLVAAMVEIANLTTCKGKPGDNKSEVRVSTRQAYRKIAIASLENADVDYKAEAESEEEEDD